MHFTSDLHQLIDKYCANPSSVTISDLPPLLDFIEQQSLTLNPAQIKQITKSGEQTPSTDIPASFVLRGQQTKAKQSQQVALLTIGVHGNEIYAGAIAALEMFKAQRQGQLRGDVLIQMGNRPAIQGFMAAYDPNIDYTQRAGWRCSFGTQLTVRDIMLPNGRKIEIRDDMNRVNRDVMTLPRGQHPNVDRAQEIIWTLRAVKQNLWPDAQGRFAPVSVPQNIGFILHPHTSRSPNGIKNLSLPRETYIALEQGQFGRPFSHAPSYMMNIIIWQGQGLGGPDNVTLTSFLARDCAAPELIVTAELGNHENIRTPDAPSLIDTTRQFTAGLMKTRGLVPESYLQKAYNRAANTHHFNIYDARDGGLKLSDFSDMAQVKDGDVLYPVRLIAPKDRQSLRYASIADRIILRDVDGQLSFIARENIPHRQAEISGAYQAFYQAWPMELSFIPKDDILFLASPPDGRTKTIKADDDFYAIFPWVMRASFPLAYNLSQHQDQKLFFMAEQKTRIEMPLTKAQPKNAGQAPRPKSN